MRPIYASLLVGAAVLGLSALALPAAGKDPAVHEMTIQLPGGGTGTVRYTGDVAPKVSFVQAPFEVSWPVPIAFSFVPSLVDMDRQMDAIWRQAEKLASWSDGSFSQAGLNSIGPGVSAYTVVSQSYGGNVCTRMTEVTTPPNGGKPKVVSRTSGTCRASPTGTVASPNPRGANTIAIESAIPVTAVPRTAL